MRKKWVLFTITLLTLQLLIEAEEVLVDTREGEMFVLEIDPDESLTSVQERISALTKEENVEGLLIEIPSDGSFFAQNLHTNTKKGSYLGYPRNYHADLSTQEKTDIKFIVTYLANKSLVSIAKEKTALEQAGDRIDHIHPLRFLMTVFMDERLKVAMRNIRGKGWVWNQFISGLKESLATESKIGNMKNEYIVDFSKKVGIDSSLIYTPIQMNQWDHFIDLLITQVPRKGDHDHYNY